MRRAMRSRFCSSVSGMKFSVFDSKLFTCGPALDHVHAAIEFAGFFSVRHHRAVTRGRVERGNARASSAQSLAQRALRIEFDLQVSAKDELLEQFVLPHIRGDHFFHLPLLEQQADAEIIDSRVIADDGQVFHAFAANSSDEVFRDAAKSEAAHKNRGAVADFFNSGVSRGDALVHSVLRTASGSLLHPPLGLKVRSSANRRSWWLLESH